MSTRASVDKIGLYAFLAVLAAVLALGFYVGNAPAEYNQDMDLVRMRDLKEIGAMVEEYKAKTGRYPLQAKSVDDIPVFVAIVTKKQRKYAEEPPKGRHVLVKVQDFIADLEKGLGRKIELPFDPQLRTTKRPIFYLYVIKGQDYELIAHLYGDYPFARLIKKHYSKLTIGNNTIKEAKIWQYQELMADPDFAQTVAKPLKKPGFIKKLRTAIRKDGAF